MSYYEEHRAQNRLLYWLGAAHTERDMNHVEYLVNQQAWPYLDRAERGEITLRDAVGALKRKLRKEEREIYAN